MVNLEILLDYFNTQDFLLQQIIYFWEIMLIVENNQ